MKCGVDFKIGYSPERINPGDEAHGIGNITKIVSGMDEETTEVLSELYDLVTTVFKAKDIKTAEAAKVIENIQRDLNIALMNELALIFERMNIDIMDVIKAASQSGISMYIIQALTWGGTACLLTPIIWLQRLRNWDIIQK